MSSDPGFVDTAFGSGSGSDASFEHLAANSIGSPKRGHVNDWIALGGCAVAIIGGSFLAGLTSSAESGHEYLVDRNLRVLPLRKWWVVFAWLGISSSAVFAASGFDALSVGFTQVLVAVFAVAVTFGLRDIEHRHAGALRTLVVATEGEGRPDPGVSPAVRSRIRRALFAPHGIAAIGTIIVGVWLLFLPALRLVGILAIVVGVVLLARTAMLAFGRWRRAYNHA